MPFWSFSKYCLCVFMVTSSVQAAELVIAVENDAAPWSYKDGKGYANDIVQAAFSAVGVKVKFEVYPYARCKKMAEDGDSLACFTSSKTADTEKDLQFPKNALINVHNVLWAPKGSAISSCDVAKWPKNLKALAVNEYEYVEKFEELKKNGILSVKIVNSEGQALEMLNQKRADVAIVNVDDVKSIEFVKMGVKLSADFQKVCDLGTLKGYLAFSKKHPEAKSAMENFDKGFNLISASGELAKIQKKWASKVLGK